MPGCFTGTGKGQDRAQVATVMIAAGGIAAALAACGGGGSKEFQPVGYDDLTRNVQQWNAEQKPVELRGQVVEFVESTDYEKPNAGPQDTIEFTVEAFLLNIGQPLPDSTLKHLRAAYHQSADLDEVLAGRDLQLVLVRWTAPYDIPQRSRPGADPYPVTPGSTVTVQGVLSQPDLQSWKHCREFGEYGCTSLRGASGPTIEAMKVDEVSSEAFGRASGPLGSDS